MKTQTRHSLMLMLCAFIWGTAFVAQSAGSGMGAYSFLAGRSWLAVLVLIPTVFAFDTVRKKQGQPYGWPKEKSERKTLLAAGLVCGTFLFAASAAQQIGITINPSTAKAAFLTAMYVVLVPVFGLFLGRRGSVQLWVSMVIAVAGLYMLCMKNGFGGIETSDWILLSCAVLFSFQIILTDIRLTAGYFDAVVQCRLDTVQKMFFVDFHLFDHFQNQAVVLMQEIIQQMLLLYFLVAEIVCGLFQVLYSLQRFLCEFTDIHNRLPPYLFGC